MKNTTTWAYKGGSWEAFDRNGQDLGSVWCDDHNGYYRAYTAIGMWSAAFDTLQQAKDFVESQAGMNRDLF